jgi:poly-gamma-glutamate capsule biosynthesis protein CapA/YwtB (metallophosphatase superfamily)
MRARPSEIGLFLCGDVMLGRGIDQIFPYPSDPRLYDRQCGLRDRPRPFVALCQGDRNLPWLVLYGCGDFLTDYEGISGHESYRGDLAVMYLPRLAVPGGRLLELRLVPFRLRKFRLDRAAHEETAWQQSTLDRESARFGTHVRLDDGNDLSVHWVSTECRP